MGIITGSPHQDQTSLPLNSAISQGLEATPPTPVLLERGPSKESIIQQNPPLRTTLAIASCTTSTSFLSAMAGQSVLLMLPAIGRDLEISQENLTWILNSYVLSYVSIAAEHLLLQIKLCSLTDCNKTRLDRAVYFSSPVGSPTSSPGNTPSSWACSSFAYSAWAAAWSATRKPYRSSS